MKTKIQKNITENDLACQISVKIEFNEKISESLIDEINEELRQVLLNLGIGFGSQHGINFIEASLLDFGNIIFFKDVNRLINNTLQNYHGKIEFVFFNKPEYLISEINFIGEQILNFQETVLELKKMYTKLQFSEIELHTDSPEMKSVSCIAEDNSIWLWVSKLVIQDKSLIRIGYRSQKMTEQEIEKIEENLKNRVCMNIEQVKWNGFDWNIEEEKWEFPKRKNLYELVKKRKHNKL